MNPNLIALHDRVADADPAGDAPAYTPAQCEAVVSNILSGTPMRPSRRSELTGRRAGAPGSHGRPMRRRLTATLVVASIVAVLAGLIATTGQNFGRGGSSESAQAVLVTAATNASDPPARASQYWENTTTSPDGQTRIQYVAVDGDRPSYFVDTYPTSRDPRQAAREAWTTDLPANQESAGWGNPNPAYLATLPRGTVALRELLYQDTAGRGNSIDGEAFTYVADLLRSGVVPADLRRSLFRVLQTIPGVDITAANAVVAGRTGTVVGYREKAPWGVHEILLDVDTGMMMGERSLGMNAWTVITRKLVNNIPAEVKAAARHDT